ncbi:MAG TPA: hypothetical protein VG297_21030 [Bryobacteraceae bacterium]|jgi:hypothetical protein|nr:hypothetical protein [Bryobacteraceae bacterium]
MKAFFVLTAFAALASAQYSGPKTVYILPMAAGLDQYLAQRLTQDHVMQVVTDPKAAEVIMTDRLGEAFEQKLREIHPPETANANNSNSSNKDEKKTDDATHNTFRGSTAKGTVFLVDAKSRAVLWSDYQKPGHDPNRTAERIAHALSGK